MFKKHTIFNLYLYTTIKCHNVHKQDILNYNNKVITEEVGITCTPFQVIPTSRFLLNYVGAGTYMYCISGLAFCCCIFIYILIILLRDQSQNTATSLTVHIQIN